MTRIKKIPPKLQRIVDSELDADEAIEFLSQPVPRFFTDINDTIN